MGHLTQNGIFTLESHCAIGRIFYIVLFSNYAMAEKCENCNKILDNPYLTHCSEECLFEILKNSKSVTDNPTDDWDNNPWI
ncbi:hypothetical protein YTPLAS73_11080 [Nitrosarchaeum sp.]|nr:hypothetical protein YTPLAS73_11080 [Nitrosarchaeum sp.]